MEGANVFKLFDDQLGHTGEAAWQSRGGHRFWLAPEDKVLSYIPDNSPVEHRVLSDKSVEVITPSNELSPIRKTLSLSLDPDSPRVTVVHSAENLGPTAQTIASWGLSVMAPGGIEIIPLPPLGVHPRDLLPNRAMILWPYTNMGDTRFQWGERFITVRQSPALGPAKFGLAHREKWIGYHRAGCFFVKSFDYPEGALYPDLGCNFETFTNEEMLEVEALGPLVTLAPGEVTSHTEHWTLVDAAPLLKQAGI